MQWAGHERTHRHRRPRRRIRVRPRRDCARGEQYDRRRRERELGGVRRLRNQYLVPTSVDGELEAKPTVTCAASDAGAASAFWVGLGGYATTSKTLEQIGTSGDCDSRTGEPSYYAWYELVPNASVTIPKFTVHPGDLITTSVNIVDNGSSVTLQVKNRTTKKNYTTTLPFANADVSSAEWVAEAPAGCDQNRCRELSLSNFGSLGPVHEDRRTRELDRRNVDREPRLDDHRDLADPVGAERLFPGPGPLLLGRDLPGRSSDLGGAHPRRARVHGVLVGNPVNFLAAS